MRDLTSGERIDFQVPAAEIALSGPRIEELGERLGAVIVAFDAKRAIPASFEPITLAKRELRPGASFGDRGALRLDFASLPADVERLMYVLYIVGGYGTGVTFRDFGSLTATIGDIRFALDFTDRGEAAMILIEFYRSKDGWRLSANGQGFVGGVGAVASAYHVTIAVPDPPRDYSGGSRGPDRDRPRSGPSSGSGFAIDQTHIVTNAHVVDGAHSVSVISEKFSAPAAIVFSDPRNDIALLRVDRDLGTGARFRDVDTIDLGEDIVVLGFPLQGLLGSGPTATAGNVSSLCGIGNDSSVLQFTAPIASGNSGGPILDSSGLVIGLVHASLNLDHVRQSGGNAENVNFGVKAPIVKTFLATTGINFLQAKAGASRNRADVVREARGYIFRIRCDE